MHHRRPIVVLAAVTTLFAFGSPAVAQRTNKPPLYGRHWVAITGKPLAAAAGARIFEQGGSAVDAACAMLAAVTTMWDVLSWGGETQALLYNPNTRKVIAINALGVAPTGATPAFFHEHGMQYPPEYGPLAAVTPGTPGGLLTMLAEYGTMSLKQVLAPAMEMAKGYPMEDETANSIERNLTWIKPWPYSRALFVTHPGEQREAPYPGEVFHQPDLLATLQKLVDAEQEALTQGKSRKQAIYAAYDRFYRGDIAQELVRSVREQGGLFTLDDLNKWRVKIEEPVMSNYHGIDVYKLTTWVQGPVMLQTLNILENFDLKAMGYNSARYIHTLYQAMNLAYADRDFYYGDPAFPPVEPIQGLLSKDYARGRAKLIDPEHNDPNVKPGDPYPFMGEKNPFSDLLANWPPKPEQTGMGTAPDSAFLQGFLAGTTSIEAADSAGWVVSVTPSGGWMPAVVAGHTGVGLSERMQSFVLDRREDPFNVLEPGKRPRATLTPMIAMQNGTPLIAAAVQGGDTQDQNLLQFFLDMTEFGMTVQQAVEAANFNSYQMHSSFGAHEARPGAITLRDDVPPWVRAQLRDMGYHMDFAPKTSGPINAIWFDRAHGTMWGGSSDYGEDYGIAW
jgi:gamma-glutamyltranspeptidase/glutathione hydrolase